MDIHVRHFYLCLNAACQISFKQKSRYSKISLKEGSSSDLLLCKQLIWQVSCFFKPSVLQSVYFVLVIALDAQIATALQSDALTHFFKKTDFKKKLLLSTAKLQSLGLRVTTFKCAICKTKKIIMNKMTTAKAQGVKMIFMYYAGMIFSYLEGFISIYKT